MTPQLDIGCQVRGHFFFSHINFKLVHSYNVKQLTFIIFCSSGLQNIYTSSIYGSVQHLQYLHCLQNFIYKIDIKVFQWAPIDVWPLTADVDCLVLYFPLLYLHGLNTRAKLYA